MTPNLDAVALLPEIIVVVTLVVVLVVDLFVDDARKGALTAMTAVGTLMAALAAIALLVTSRTAEMVGGNYVVDGFALVTKTFFLLATVIVLALGAPMRWKGEYLLMVSASTLGAVVLVSARELITFVVAFELLAVPGYLLTGWRKGSRLGHEAALKFFLLGVVATAVMLYGISLLFGQANSTSFSAIASGTDNGNGLTVVGVVFVVLGMAYKFSAVPLHFWAPDAYQGAPFAVAAFLSVVSKAAGLFATMVLLLAALGSIAELWAPVLAVLATASMVVGNVVALKQQDFVRLLAYSSVAQTGYALVPLAVALEYGGSVGVALESTFAFLAIFALANLAAFGVAIAVDSNSLDGLFHRNSLLAAVVALAMLSLAGVPPFAGWFAKLVVFRAALESGSAVGVTLAVIVAVGSAIGLYFYAVVVARLWRPTDAPTIRPPRPATTAALGVCSIAVLVVGVLPGVVTSVAEYARF